MHLAQDMGLTVKQMIEMMKQKGRDEVVIPVSSGMPPPPPPPPPPMRISIATPPSSRTASVQPPTPAALVPVSRSRTTSAARPPLPQPASRPVSAEPVPIVRDPSLPRPAPIRDPSLASTTDYRSRSRTTSAKPQPPRAASAEPIPVHRDPSVVSLAEDAGPSILLPIKERRGRSVTRKADTHIAKRAIALLAKKQQIAQEEGQLRVHLGRFARKFQAAQRAPQAASVPAPKVRDYDAIEREIDEDPLAGGVRKKITFPETAFLHRQRVDSAGERRLRYQGRAIRA